MIKGNPKVIEEARKIQPGNPASMVCWDAENLHESLVLHVSKVLFTGDDWEPVGNGNFMPSTTLVNDICEAAGISGTDLGGSKAVYQEIDWNRLICNFNAPPKMVRYHVGYESTKHGSVITPDGSRRVSDPCVVLYNVWERICADFFGKEESESNYYDPSYVLTHKNGSKYIVKTKKDKTTYNLYFNYGNRAARQKLFDDELKFAQRKSDTKARNVVIRVLTGMPTGYPLKDLQGTLTKKDYKYYPVTETVDGNPRLKTGALYFSRIEKSDSQISKEASARIERISGSVQVALDEDIFGTPKKIEKDVTEPIKDPVEPPESEEIEEFPTEPIESQTAEAKNTFVESEEKVNQKEEYLRILDIYEKANLIKPELVDKMAILKNWVTNTPDPEKNEKYWTRATNRLKEIELAIPVEMRQKHKVK